MSQYLPAEYVMHAQARINARAHGIDEQRFPKKGYPAGADQYDRKVRLMIGFFGGVDTVLTVFY